MVVSQSDPHGLFGYPEQSCHICHQCFRISACPKAVKGPLYLRNGHENSGTKDISLDLHVILLSSKCHSRTFSSPLIEFLVKDPVGQLMSTGKAQPASSLLILAEGCVNKNRSRFDGEKDIRLHL